MTPTHLKHGVRIVQAALAVCALAWLAPIAARAGSMNYCGIAYYSGVSPGTMSGQDKVYVTQGHIGCADARVIDRSADLGRPVHGWTCSLSLAQTVTTCRGRQTTIKGYAYVYERAGPGRCSDVSHSISERATDVVARATGCHEAGQVALADMQTPACATNCTIEAGFQGEDHFTCRPQGKPRGADRAERCETFDGGPLVAFTIVKGPS
jgi:hypothetical protein